MTHPDWKDKIMLVLSCIYAGIMIGWVGGAWATMMGLVVVGVGISHIGVMAQPPETRTTVPGVAIRMYHHEDFRFDASMFIGTYIGFGALMYMEHYIMAIIPGIALILLIAKFGDKYGR